MPLLDDNNETVWDWITWETLGNPSEKFRKGDEAFNFGLWRADYEMLCKAGQGVLKPAHTDGGLGRGWVKVHVLESMEYRAHAGLIKTFLPSFTIDKDGRLMEPFDSKRAQIPVGPHYVVMPYNYDDNGSRSRAFGTDLFGGLVQYCDAKRLEEELIRWSTASRSCIAVIFEDGVDASKLYVYSQDELKKKLPWPFRDTKNIQAKVFGEKPGTRRYFTYEKVREEQSVTRGPKYKFYSVKTGVEFVGTESQKVNNKDILESNSVHAMHRSDLIAYVRKNYREPLSARYQIEVLCVQMPSDHAAWDGFQIRDLGDAGNEIWFPALAIPNCGKSFALNWGGEADWVAFWRENFARPLGRAKGEMLAFFGMQHMTANAQNMLIAFDRGKSKGAKAEAVILRDIGDTLLNDHFFDTLTLIDKKFSDAWSFETSTTDGVTLTKSIGGGYADPLMTRLGGTFIFFFGPFVQADILAGKTAPILADWSLAHNVGFIEYMRDNLAYHPDWQDAETPGLVPVDLGTRLREHAVPMPNSPTYATLVKDVLALHAKQRWTLIEAIENECKALGDKEVDKARKLSAAHEMLLGAEVENYMQTKKGAEALAYLHRVMK